MKSELMGAMQKATEALHQYGSRTISLYHHNDTDGICAGSILLNSFTKCGYSVSSFSLEKPYPLILEQILSRSRQIIIFTDFAGKIAPLISEKNNNRNLVIILDHHPAEDTDDPMVFNLNGDLFGLKGDRDISASATAYLFADLMLRRNGSDDRLLSHLGALGAIGDGFFVDGGLSSVNREILKTAEKENLMRTDATSEGEVYYITIRGVEYPAAVICDSLDALGGVGYYENGAAAGRELCLNGFSQSIHEKIQILKKKRDELFSQELKNLKTEIQSTEHIQWFNVEDRFRPMGVKMIGVFCTQIKDMGFIDKKKYLAGFQNIPDSVPGFGEIPFNSTKISMRVSEYLTEEIRSSRAAGLNTFLPEATYTLGGFVDACHGLSAATTVEKGKEKALIDQIEKEIKKRLVN